MHLREAEAKDEFLERARAAVGSLRRKVQQ
jgi:hypothetical protein